MKNQEMIDRLNQLPAQIAAETHKLIGLNTELEEKNHSYSKEEMKIKLEIADEVDDKGKKIYSNAESREAALVERVEGNEGLTDLAREIKSLEIHIQSLRVDIDQLSHEQRNIRSIMQFIASGSVSDL
jgi:chromosome segregation ATPase